MTKKKRFHKCTELTTNLKATLSGLFCFYCFIFRRKIRFKKNINKKNKEALLKILLKTITVIIIVLALAYIAFCFLVPEKVSKELSEKLNVPVHIESITPSLDAIEIAEIEIANPENSHFPAALRVKKTTIEAFITNYLSEKITIDEIDLDTVYVSLEFDSAKGTSGNWSQLMNNLKANQTPSENKNNSVSIKKIKIKNIQVDLFYKDTHTTRTLPVIKEISLKNINNQTGFPLDQIMQSVLGEMLTSIFIQENLKNMIDGILAPKNEIQSLLDPIENLFK